jgi:hypothetical protein
VETGQKFVESYFGQVFRIIDVMATNELFLVAQIR